MSRLDDITISRAAWGAKPPTQVDRTFTKDEGIVVHYTATDSARLTKHWPDCYESWRSHQRYHQVTKGWWDLAYNFGVCPHGFVFEGRGWDAQNGANRPLNDKTLSICFDGDGNDVPIGPVVRSFKDLIDRAVVKGWDRQVRGHGELPRANTTIPGTACPGSAIKAGMLPELKAYVRSGTPPTPPYTDPPALPLDRVVILGPPTTDIGQMQRWAKNEGGSLRFVQLAPVAFWESVHIGVDPAVTYAIMRHETNAGLFDGVLSDSKKNWGGIKTAVGGSNTDPAAHATFPSDQVGVRAVAQHAGRYAGLELPAEDLVDPRWMKVTPGVAPSLPDDDWVWAADSHDDRVVAHIRALRRA